jgi:hypothetical protein
MVAHAAAGLAGAVGVELPVAVLAGAVVIDNSSAFRMDPDVLPVVPEINAGRSRSPTMRYVRPRRERCKLDAGQSRLRNSKQASP